MLKRLIEVALPLKEVSEQSAREKSIRHGHISTLHIWWARRPLAACRAIVFASLIPDPDDPECPDSFRTLVNDLLPQTPNGEDLSACNAQAGDAQADTPRNRCLEFIKHLVRWENSNDKDRIGKARKLIAAAHKFLHPESKDEMPKVLDPFAGGGAIPLEALRLGCEAHAIDLNPVAHLIELCTLVYPQKYGQPNSRPTPDYINKLEAAHEGKDGDGLFSNNGRKNKASDATEIEGIALTRLPLITEADYQKNPLAADVKFWGHWVQEKASEEIGQFYPSDPDGSIPVAYLWARTVKCPNPACGALVPLVRQLWLCKRPNRKVAMQTIPDRATKRTSIQIVEGDAIKFDPADGTMQRGNATCPSCEQVNDSSHLKAEGRAGRLGQQMMAVMSINSGRAAKSYRLALPEDIDCFEKAKAALERLKQASDEELIPAELIPAEDSRAIFVHLYGLTRWGDLFNARQALAITTFLHRARRVAAILRQHHEEDYGKAVASIMAILVDRLASFDNSLVRWANHRETANTPFSNNGFPMTWDFGEINPFSGSTGDWASSIEWVTRVIEANAFTLNPAVVTHASATRQSFGDSSFAAVITDPPYYDAVPYADLSDFFYVWLRRTVGHLFPDVFRTPLTPKAQELIAYRSPGRRDIQKTEAWYEQGMGEAFAEMY